MVTAFHHIPVNVVFFKQLDGLNFDSPAVCKASKTSKFPLSKFCAIRYIQPSSLYLEYSTREH